MPKARRCSLRISTRGADPALRLRARVFTEYAWHSLFIRNLLIRPPVGGPAAFVPELTIVDLPSFRADPKRHGARSETIIACDFTRKIVLIGGTSYAGEMKKSVFTVLNYLLPRNRSCRCIARPTPARTATRRSSSASPAPARPRSPPIRTARSSATTSMGGAATASSISRAAATPRRSSCRARRSLRSIRRPNVSAPSWRT